jgi:hypothetical protein
VTDAYDPEADALEPEAVERATRLPLCSYDKQLTWRTGPIEQLASFRSYVEHNEPELALGELAHFADAHPPAPPFWRLLADAAASLKLTEDEPYHGSGVQIVNRHLPE